MYASKCVLEGKRGIEELDRRGPYTVIANRTLFDHGRAHKFTIVNAEKEWVENVYRSFREARSALHSLNPQA